MLITILISSLLGAHAAAPLMDADQFSRMMAGLHGPIRDLEMIYEGEEHFVGPPSLMLPKGADFTDTQFQGVYAYRDDGAMLLDMYSKRLAAGGLLAHNTYAVLGERLETLELVPDRDSSRGRIRVGEGSGASLARPESPHRILFLWYFREFDAMGQNFKDLGWEDIDGHRCLKIQADAYKGLTANSLIMRFWIDMERGGHPLKVEQFDKSKLRTRAHGIKLARFKLSAGEDVWLPVRGVFESFEWDDGFHDEPLYRETYGVVDGSVRLNQRLSDQYFTAKRKPSARTSASLGTLRQEFEQARTLATSAPLRGDPLTAQQVIDKALAEADGQARMIEASSPAREGAGWTTVVQFGFAMLGTALISGAAVWRWGKR